MGGAFLCARAGTILGTSEFPCRGSPSFRQIQVQGEESWPRPRRGLFLNMGPESASAKARYSRGGNVYRALTYEQAGAWSRAR
jgi:hypothetical protein